MLKPQSIATRTPETGWKPDKIDLVDLEAALSADEVLGAKFVETVLQTIDVEELPIAFTAEQHAQATDGAGHWADLGVMVTKRFTELSS